MDCFTAFSITLTFILTIFKPKYSVKICSSVKFKYLKSKMWEIKVSNKKWKLEMFDFVLHVEIMHFHVFGS